MTSPTDPIDAFPSPASGPSPAASPATVPGDAARSGFEAVMTQFAQEYLRDRRSDRRWRFIVRLAWLLLGIVLAWGWWAQAAHTSTSSAPHTALVELRGEIAADGPASAEFLLTGLKSAFEDDSAKAVVIRINSPGGSPVQAGILYDEIRRLKTLHNKKVYVVVEESCASGAYYVAAAADAIYVDKASIVGSIGVLMDGFGFTGAMEKFGIERRLLTAGENKGMLDPFSPLQDKQRAFALTMLAQIHQQFIHVVKEGRGTRLKDDPDLFSGLFWNGEQAVKLGLADGLGNLDSVARDIVKAEDIIDYTPKENVAERLAKRFGASVGAGAVHALRSVGGLR
jgi:protease-4